METNSHTNSYPSLSAFQEFCLHCYKEVETILSSRSQQEGQVQTLQSDIQREQEYLNSGNTKEQIEAAIKIIRYRGELTKLQHEMSFLKQDASLTKDFFMQMVGVPKPRILRGLLTELYHRGSLKQCSFLWLRLPSTRTTRNVEKESPRFCCPKPSPKRDLHERKR